MSLRRLKRGMRMVIEVRFSFAIETSGNEDNEEIAGRGIDALFDSIRKGIVSPELYRNGKRVSIHVFCQESVQDEFLHVNSR